MDEQFKRKDLTINEVASLLGVGSGTIRRWIKEKKLEAHRLGKIWRIEREHIEHVIKFGLSEGIKEPDPQDQ